LTFCRQHHTSRKLRRGTARLLTREGASDGYSAVLHRARSTAWLLRLQHQRRRTVRPRSPPRRNASKMSVFLSFGLTYRCLPWSHSQLLPACQLAASGASLLARSLAHSLALLTHCAHTGSSISGGERVCIHREGPVGVLRLLLISASGELPCSCLRSHWREGAHAPFVGQATFAPPLRLRS